MTWRGIALLMLAAPALMGAEMPVLVPDVSQRQIDIKYSFSGEELLLFGAIVYPDGHPPKKAPDIVVVLKGPEQAVRMREKDKVAGIWVNADAIRFQSAPSFYAIASTRPLKDIADERTAAIYELGTDNIQLSPASFENSEEISRFEAGVIDMQSSKGLYVQRP